MSEHPFTDDGVQAVTVHAEGCTWQPMPEIRTTACAAERAVAGGIDLYTRFTDRITVDYYGYDPCVREDDGTVIGTDGMPDWQGTYNPETEEVDWVRA